MVYAQLLGEADIDERIVGIFEMRTDVDFLHVRNAEACCYICRVDRA